ncbi:MAG: response regulator [Ruminiclostridium sp.]|nr:response regulator [Ruminiclostridium sp.]
MYRLIIVDDEANIRDRLKKNIDWRELEVEFAGEAEDGIEAFNLFEAAKPNIVIMDINLSSKNGIEVSREILEVDPDVKIIIITGYNDFEHAQKALKIGAFDLLGKPVNRDDICTAIKKACSALDMMKEEKLKSERIQKILLESMPVLREKFISSVVEGESGSSAGNTRERIAYLGIDIENSYYNSAVVTLNINNTRTNENDLILTAAKNIIEEMLSQVNIKNFVYYDNLYRLIIIFSYSEFDVSKRIDMIFSNIKDKIKFYLNVETYTGIGVESASADDLSFSYKSAFEALNYRNLFGLNNVINIKNVNKIESIKAIYCSSDIDNIIMSFKAGNLKELDMKLNILLNRVITVSMCNMQHVKRMFIELMAAIVRVYSQIELKDQRILVMEDPYSRIMSFNNIVELKDWMLKVCSELSAVLNEMRQNKLNNVVEMAKKFISESYKDESLNLKMVSDYVGLSSVYFCQLFYQETGSHFSEYLNAVRMEHAKRLLKDTCRKIYEIAYDVGYSNPKHFNMIFKRISGMTPVEYRSSPGGLL